MNIYCLERFKVEFEKLKNKKPYKNLEPELIEYFFDKECAALCNGTRLNNSSTEPYIKKRLDGAGGYRTYYLIVIKDDCLYLMFVHPKTGPDGAENITPESKAAIYKDVLECIKSKDLYELSLPKDKSSIIFEKVKEEKATASHQQKVS
ncbi:hypothetical protein [Mucilaginibacter lappiensis]|uniref:Addiction module toxin RelE n=1 Tax=Mucilaginibacter lappiensis TaxID=354630 RepID=A0A841J9D2_9SPHI|nr:hypothetical protein [Mucilaginibacter lappiensis]MBB6126952.1 hypothetical protein [Mucilaginibacter lappiensis]